MRLQTLMPEKKMKLGYPPLNTYMPRPEQIVSKKVKRATESAASEPVKIETDLKNFEIFFKQDDTFDQPLVKMDLKICTTDCGFPYSL